MDTYSSQQHALHFPQHELCGGEMVRPFECPERWDFIAAELATRSFSSPLEPAKLDRTVLEQVHSAKYIHFLENAWSLWTQAGFTADALPTVFPARRMQQREPEHIDGKLGYYCMAIETAITAGTWQAALSSAACAQSAAKAISSINAGNAQALPCSFALCRPPGHHAGIDLYGGYCFLNNAAIAAQTLRNNGASRVAVLDVDFHHGNGTQDIFYQRDDVLFASLHGEPATAFPHFLGYADECGAGKGEGCNHNYPLPEGTVYSVWLEALQDAMRKIRSYSPDALVISLGVDTYKDDPISYFKLDSDDFTHYGVALAGLNLPTVFVMEGGYAVEQIGVNTVNVLSGFEQGLK